MNQIYGNHQQVEIGLLQVFQGTITTPDSNGNYTVTPEQSFEDSSDTTEYSCFTEYGGVKKTFYFKKKNSSTSTSTYNINCKIWVTGNGHEISICADIESHDIQMPIPGYDVHDVHDIYDLLRKDVIDTQIKVYIGTTTIVTHVIDFELSSYTWNGYVTPHFKYTVKFPNYNDNIVEKYGIGGIDDDINTKNKTITSTYNKCIYNVNYYIE